MRSRTQWSRLSQRQGWLSRGVTTSPTVTGLAPLAGRTVGLDETPGGPWVLVAGTGSGGPAGAPAWPGPVELPGGWCRAAGLAGGAGSAARQTQCLHPHFVPLHLQVTPSAMPTERPREAVPTSVASTGLPLSDAERDRPPGTA